MDTTLRETEPSFEPERERVERFLKQQYGRGTALLPQNEARKIIGQFRDGQGKMREIEIELTHEGMDIENLVQESIRKAKIIH